MRTEKYYEMYAEEYTEDKWVATGERIRKACEKSGYMLADLARPFGLAPKSFYKIVRGEVECKTKYLYEISQYLDVSVDYLLFGRTDQYDSYDEITAMCKNISSIDMHRLKKVLLAFTDNDKIS